MPHLFVESDANEPGPFAFTGDTTDLLALLSFGVAQPFGSQHPLTQLVGRLKNEQGLDMGPLLTFYDRAVENEQDATNLAAAWQDAASLYNCVVVVRRGINADPEASASFVDFPTIPYLLTQLEHMAAWAAARDARIRITFSLSGEARGESR